MTQNHIFKKNYSSKMRFMDCPNCLSNPPPFGKWRIYYSWQRMPIAYLCTYVCSTELGNLGYKNFWNFEMSTYVYLCIYWPESSVQVDMLPIPMKLPPKTFWFRITYIIQQEMKKQLEASTWTRWFGSIYVGHIPKRKYGCTLEKW